jgi:phage repressor protein C with HTH and peptisase S24 domain
METTVKQRLIEYLKLKGIGQNRFEKMAGLSIGYISKLRIEPSPTKLRGIINAAPDLNQEWLLTGKGEMLVTDVTPMRKSELEEYTETKAGLKFFTREDGQIVMKVPVVPIAALGSPEDEFAELVKEHEGDTVSVVVDSVHHGSYVAFCVDGDSMDDGTRDSFERGDIVVVRELSRDKWLPKLHFKDWPYWVVCFGNNVRLKQIVAHDGPTITCHSINPSPEYTDFTLNLDDVQRLFNVVKKVPKEINYGI